MISTLYEDSDCIAFKIGRMTNGFLNASADPSYSEEKSVILSSAEEEVTKECHENAKKFLYFDGHFWERCYEPKYIIQTFGLGNNDGGTGLFVDYVDAIMGGNVFNALEGSEAKAFFKDTALGRGDTESVQNYNDHPTIEVVREDILSSMVTKRPPKWEIKISYSWGDEESPYKSFDSKEDAYKKACELACNEAYEYNSEFDADRRCEVLFDAASLSISLHYLGDDSWCYYNIETVSITHHLT